MTWKDGLILAALLVGIACGEAIKLGYTEWAQLTALTYWLGIGVQLASLAGVYARGLYQQPPQK